MQEQLKDPTHSIETLRPPPNPRGGGSLPSVGKSASLDRDLPDFSIEEMHRQIVKFIVADNQTISVVECAEFHWLLCLLQQDLKDSHISHRTKFWQLIIDAWDEYFTAIKLDLAAAQGQISFTSDIWSNAKLRPFLAVTAHWIVKENKNVTLVLKAAVTITLALGRYQCLHSLFPQ
ncbi:hypothetical protein BD769DRAFT_1665205 [Suillus cothurnatus]|nr:hypothetical protein BD769DRAFT_1665205 [Suillus cothurnatus]